MKLTLASTSKFKSEILNKVGLNHFKIESNFEENSTNNNVYEYVKELSCGKVESVKDKVKEGFILGLDTVVYIDGKILEKPKTIEDAKEAIRLCMNKTVSVITGITLYSNEYKKEITNYAETFVTLRNISEEDINYYIDHEQNIMYASGFVIETIISNFIEKIDGSYYNILGIPVETIYKYINSFGIYLKDLECDCFNK